MEGAVVFQFAVPIVFGAICAMIASSRGRSAVGWFFIGFFLQCIGLIILLVIPDLRAQEAQVQRLRDQNRRLRERVRKDRQVADQRHDQTARRLTAHDRALGVDTSPRLEGAESIDGLIAPPPLPDGEHGEELVEAGDHAADHGEWYYAVNTRQVGPLPLSRLEELWRQGRIGRSTLVWREEMSDWRRVSDLPDLERALRERG
ncbi:MAG: DUF4339 domain-containing protein [Planctomycetota bacterium]